MTMGIGLTDKLYWRPGDDGRFHCFKRLSESSRRPGEKFISLCHRQTKPVAGGGRLARPPVGMRCGMCDGLEMKRRGKDESIEHNNEHWMEFLL